MRRKKHSSPENHERWLVSYADFITLLFAFFVVMFASNQQDKAHAKAVSEAIKNALADGTLQTRIAAILGGSADKADKGNLMQRGPGGSRTTKAPKASEPLEAVPLTTPMKVLTDNLQQEIAAGNIHLKLEARGLVIGLQTAAFFSSGGDAVSPAAYPTLAKVAEVLNKVPNALRLEGHTDSIPINTPRFQSNWELSAARSIAMLRLLNQRFGVNSQRMAVVGYADNAAIDSNETEKGRERNRRVDIVIVSDFGMRAEPPQADMKKPGKETQTRQKVKQTEGEKEKN
jgi:chemotaxis protein MotB